MKVLFHINTLCYRGTTTAVLDYAKYNQEILGNESVISYWADGPTGGDGGNETSAINLAQSKFELRKIYNHNYNSVCLDIDLAYFIRAGNREPLPDSVPTAVHAVFQLRDPYGDRYAYISRWLSEHMSSGTIPYVPHMVDLPPPTRNPREKLGISPDKTIIGRLGGRDTFDISFAHDAVREIVTQYPEYVFVFLNTKEFIRHPNVIYINPTNDPQAKSNFINMCDGLLHARSNGESFGLAICEGLFFNKPVFSWRGGNDQHHAQLLANSGLLYNNKSELIDQILNVKSYQENYRSLVDQFAPKAVMEQFHKVFLT
jgi:hypothetical protein